MRGNIYAWVRDFLSQRKQCVTVNDACSRWRNITSGIPQGSVLGPILFLIHVFINVLPEEVKCINLFADDVKYQIIKTDQDKTELQEDVRNLEEWAVIWKVFYTKKCKHLHAGTIEACKYYMTSEAGNVEIEIVDQEKDLGAIVDSKLQFRHHIVSKVSTANRNLGIIFRTFTVKKCFSVFISLW